MPSPQTVRDPDRHPVSPGAAPVTARQMLERVRGAGLNLTRHRRAIITAACRMPHAFSVADLCADPGLRRVSLICVYRNLLKFENISLVRRSFTRRGGFLFQLQQAGPPDSITMTCRQCGDRESIPDAQIARIHLELAQRGYRSVGHLAEFAGICPACALAASRPAPRPWVSAQPKPSPGDAAGRAVRKSSSTPLKYFPAEQVEYAIAAG